MVFTLGRMVIVLGEIMSRETRRGKECLFGRMVTSTKECGRMI